MRKLLCVFLPLSSVLALGLCFVSSMLALGLCFVSSLLALGLCSGFLTNCAVDRLLHTDAALDLAQADLWTVSSAPS
jgi:hypothetical protein